MDAMLRDPSRKQALVTPMFDLVAPRYDAFTRRFSLGMDARWKASVVRRAIAAAPRGARVLDVACGTGDITLAIARGRPDVTVIGLDASGAMLRLAEARRVRLAVPNVQLTGGDLGCLGLPNDSVDLITGGYAIRNAPSWEAAIHELARVLRPGGHLCTLDFFRPANPLWRSLFLSYLSAAGRVVGWWWHRAPMAYGYIARSIVYFTTIAGFNRALEAAGFRVVAVESHLGGGIAVHQAVLVATHTDTIQGAEGRSG